MSFVMKRVFVLITRNICQEKKYHNEKDKSKKKNEENRRVSVKRNGNEKEYKYNSIK